MLVVVTICLLRLSVIVGVPLRSNSNSNRTIDHGVKTNITTNRNIKRVRMSIRTDDRNVIGKMHGYITRTS